MEEGRAGDGRWRSRGLRLGIFPSTMLVPQISTQRKINIYNILQEIIQQEGELEEQCVHRLVTIASKEMREILEVVELWASLVSCLSANLGWGCWWAWPVTTKALVQPPPRARTG